MRQGRLSGVAFDEQRRHMDRIGQQHVGIVRFNPFSDKGGDQSFAIAILDDHADGIVLSSMQSRTDNRVYGKPVVGGQSTYTLGNEEREAIARAMKPRA